MAIVAEIDITIEGGSWHNINDLASTAYGDTTTFAAGVAMKIQNKSVAWVILQSVDTQPNDDYYEGTVLTSADKYYSTTTTAAEESSYYVRCVNDEEVGVINLRAFSGD